jgi:regulator of sirC expression with transglutaminase-like and TPR domain
MSCPALPHCCRPEAFELLTEQNKSIDSPDALLLGALAIASHQLTNLAPRTIDNQLQKYTDLIRKRVRGQQVQAILAHLHELLFDELKLVGNREDYYNVANSYLPSVLETRKGLPITLSLIYQTIAQRLGLRTWGVALPGHFLVAVEEFPGKRLLVDPFAAGRILTVDEAQDRVQELFGDDVEWSEDLLRPAPHRHWLTRILQNMLHIFSTANQYTDVAAVLEMEMILWPQQAHLQRDLALVLARIGLAGPASAWLDAYLQGNPDDPQSSDLKQLLNVLTA